MRVVDMAYDSNRPGWNYQVKYEQSGEVYEGWIPEKDLQEG